MSIFSAVGSYHCMGALALNLHEHGFRYTVCQLPKKIDMQGFDLDIWVCFFVLSKVAEFFDTVLKILLKRPFIFLHWYHHVMTAWLGWLSLAYDASAGQWYAGLNFTVHAPMYFYYFLSSMLDKDQFRCDHYTDHGIRSRPSRCHAAHHMRIYRSICQEILPPDCAMHYGNPDPSNDRVHFRQHIRRDLLL